MGRVFHTDDRTWSNFQTAELVKLCGVSAGRWPVYVLKELVDNAFAALEEHRIVNPMVWIELTDDYICVYDNGPGMPDFVVDSVVDFDSFGGSNRHAKLPTRGAQGNALMTIIGITTAWMEDPFIIITRPDGRALELMVKLDSVYQRVSIERTEFTGPTRSGIKVPCPTLPWKRGGESMEDVARMARWMAQVNPHVTVFIRHEGKQSVFPSKTGAGPALPNAPEAGAPGWYTRDDFAAKIAADLRARPTVDKASWAAEFLGVPRRNGLIGNLSEVAAAAAGDEAKFYAMAGLLRDQLVAMADRRLAENPGFQPIGEERLTEALIAEYGADAESPAQYHAVRGVSSAGIPFLVEACLVQMPVGCRSAPQPKFLLNRTVLYGSPTFKGVKWREKVRGDWQSLTGDIGALARAYQIDGGKTPCAVIVHATCPAPGYTGYGKQAFDTEWLVEPLSEVLERVTLQIRKQRAGESRRVKSGSESDASIRDTLFELLPGVLERDTEGGKLPIMLRQLYYGVRKIWHLHHHRVLQYATYCAYVDEYERRVNHAICLKDPRGTLIEPHSGRELRLGTDAVNRYSPKKWEGHTIIFVEKEQFAHTLKAYGVTKRYDAIVIGSKGFAVESCREVLQKYKRLLGDTVKIVCLHDADPAGYMIGYDLATNLPRFGDNVSVKVIDVGLTIEEATEMGLQDEPFDLKKSVWSMVRGMRTKSLTDHNGRRRPLLDDTAYDAFMPRLVRGDVYPDWIDNPTGRRVELNAMAPRQFIEWLEGHLEAEGCRKVRPPDEVVDETLARARENHFKNEVGNWLMKKFGDDIVHELLGKIGVPAHELDAMLISEPEKHWEELVKRAAVTGADLRAILDETISSRMKIL